MTNWQVFKRAFAIVFLTAANVVNISHSQWILMTLTGFGISWLWWENTQCAVDYRNKLSQCSYAGGAAVGTLVGVWVAQLLGGLLK
jgi:hypothetical protein